MPEVKSSFIESYEYQDGTLTLTIRGKSYEFPNVPQDEIALLQETIQSEGSIGRWYNTRIKGRYGV